VGVYLIAGNFVVGSISS